MKAAWKKCHDEEIPNSIGVNVDDAQSFFEDGWRAGRSRSRIVLDDATVERAAKVLPHDQRCSGLYPCGCWDDRVDTARAVLSAAVQEER